jgi:hypothetical protein
MNAPGPVRLNPFANQPNPNVVPGTYTSETNQPAMSGGARGVPNRYAAPDLDIDNNYNDEFGWADGLLPYGDIWGTPDATRVNTQPQQDFYRGPTSVNFFEDRDDDDRIRHMEEVVDGNGWQEEKGFKKVGLFNPRDYPPPETRWTEQQSPTTYSFVRYYDQLHKGSGARTFNGNHYSEAEHPRRYDILGMQPPKVGRNTYRLNPVPWDSDSIDVPPQVAPDYVPLRIQALSLAPSQQGRSYRAPG